jgi:SAM-dependent methyltransferase
MEGDPARGGRDRGLEEKMGIAERYDRLSGGYDELYGEEQGRKYDLALGALEGVHGMALDVGCGTGSLFSRLAGSPEVVGVDLSQGMLRIARERHGRAHLIRADAESLPLRDGLFDIAFCFTVFSSLAGLKASLPELKRVLKPLSTIVLSAPKGAFDRESLMGALGPLGACRLIDGGVGDYVCICRLEAGRRPQRPFQEDIRSATSEATKAKRRAHPRGANHAIPMAEEA